MRASSRLRFATSSNHKFKEAELILANFGLRIGRLRAKGMELQSDDVGEIAANAASAISAKHSGPLFVEDTGLFVRALGGFPGAYAAFAYRTIGPDGVLRLLARSADRSAEFVSAVAFVEASRRPRVFLGRLEGSIARRPRGSGGFGFDSIFLPLGSSSTLAEMSLDAKCAVSHRAAALRAMCEWLLSREKRGIFMSPTARSLPGF